MANVNYEDLFWQVRADVPGVPLPMLFFNYAEAVREHLSRSKAWQYSIASALDLGASTAWPTISAGTEIPASTYVVEPVKVKWYDGTPITFKTRDQLDDIDGDWEQATASTPNFWTSTSPGVWSVYPLLSTAVTGALYIRVAIAPTVAVDSSLQAIPEYLAYEFSAAWANGTLARLLKMPGKDWTDLKLALAYSAQFETDIKTAKSRAAADFGRPVRTVEYGGLSLGGSGRSIPDDYGS